MARQLQAQGQRVDLLVLLHSRTQYDARLRFGHRVIATGGKLLGLNLEQQVVPYLLYRAARPWVDAFVHLDRAEQGRLLRALGARMLHGVRGGRTAAAGRAQAEAMIEACRQKDWSAPVFWACSGYVPGPYAGKVTLCWWTHEPRDGKDPTMGWGKVAREVEVRYIPGSRDVVLWGRPYLQAFGEHLQACLASVQPA
jgi:thioesterase domain-containing protein